MNPDRYLADALDQHDAAALEAIREQRLSDPGLRLEHFLDTAPRKMLLDALYRCLTQHWNRCPDAWARLDDEPIKAVIAEAVDVHGVDLTDLFSDIGWDEYEEAS